LNSIWGIHHTSSCGVLNNQSLAIWSKTIDIEFTRSKSEIKRVKLSQMYSLFFQVTGDPMYTLSVFTQLGIEIVFSFFFFFFIYQKLSLSPVCQTQAVHTSKRNSWGKTFLKYGNEVKNDIIIHYHLISHLGQLSCKFICACRIIY
jgi:hypothetical protein